MMRSLENRKRSSVSACPQLQCEPHLLTEGGEEPLKQFDYREIITFFPLLSPVLSISLSLCCAQRPSSAQHDSSLHCCEYQSAGLKMRSCYCRCTVCANREERCTWLWRGDRIMMSSGNIAASFHSPQFLFFLHTSRQAVVVTAHRSCYFVIFF